MDGIMECHAREYFKAEYFAKQHANKHTYRAAVKA